MSVPMGGDRLPELSELSLGELSDYDVDAGFERFLEATAGVPIDEAPTPAAATAPAPIGVWTRLALWGPAVLVMGVSLGFGLRHGESPLPEAVLTVPSAAPATREAPRAASVVGLAEAAPSAEVEGTAPTPTDATKPSATSRPQAGANRPQRSSSATASATATPTETPGALEAELELAARMRKALPEHPADALRLAREGQSRFPQGMFVKERLEHEVLALLRLDRKDEAARLAERFLSRYPSGPQSDRVRRALKR